MENHPDGNFVTTGLSSNSLLLILIFAAHFLHVWWQQRTSFRHPRDSRPPTNVRDARQAFRSGREQAHENHACLDAIRHDARLGFQDLQAQIAQDVERQELRAEFYRDAVDAWQTGYLDGRNNRMLLDAWADRRERLWRQHYADSEVAAGPQPDGVPDPAMPEEGVGPQADDATHTAAQDGGSGVEAQPSSDGSTEAAPFVGQNERTTGPPNSTRVDSAIPDAPEHSNEGQDATLREPDTAEEDVAPARSERSPGPSRAGESQQQDLNTRGWNWRGRNKRAKRDHKRH